MKHGRDLTAILSCASEHLRLVFRLKSSWVLENGFIAFWMRLSSRHCARNEVNVCPQWPGHAGMSWCPLPNVQRSQFDRHLWERDGPFHCFLPPRRPALRCRKVVRCDPRQLYSTVITKPQRRPPNHGPVTEAKWEAICDLHAQSRRLSQFSFDPAAHSPVALGLLGEHTTPVMPHHDREKTGGATN